MHQWRALIQGEYAQLQLFPFRSPAVAAAKSRVHAALQQHLRRRARSRQPDPFPIHERAAQQPPHEPGAVLWHTVTAGCGGDAATHRQGGGGGGHPLGGSAGAAAAARLCAQQLCAAASSSAPSCTCPTHSVGCASCAAAAAAPSSPSFPLCCLGCASEQWPALHPARKLTHSHMQRQRQH